MKRPSASVRCSLVFLLLFFVLLGLALRLALVPVGAAGLGDHLVALARRTVAAHQRHRLCPGLRLGVALAPLDAAVVAAAETGLALLGDCAVGLTCGVTSRLELVHPGTRVGCHIAGIPRSLLVAACFLAVPGELLGGLALPAAALEDELALLGVGLTVALLPRFLLVATLLSSAAP